MIDAILARRSIRKYTDEPVSDEHIRAILEAAMSAPSGMNRKPWHFVAVTDREKLDRLGATTTSWGMLKEAPLAVVVCGDPGISEKYWDQDSIAALEKRRLARVPSEPGAGRPGAGDTRRSRARRADRRALDRAPGGGEGAADAVR